jgi:hypothetical protein
VRASPQQSSPARSLCAAWAAPRRSWRPRWRSLRTFGDDGFDYLLNMPVSSLTSERVQHLEDDAVVKRLSSTPSAAPEPLDMDEGLDGAGGSVAYSERVVNDFKQCSHSTTSNHAVISIGSCNQAEGPGPRFVNGLTSVIL